MNIYNKKINDLELMHGTLNDNWNEEAVLREITVEGRNICKVHIPKKWWDLENPIIHDKVFDDTHVRIHGIPVEETYDTYNHSYGKETNPADNFPKIGEKSKLIDSKVNLI